MPFLKPSLAPLFPSCYPLETSAKTFDFFGLPPEVRNTIYDMVYTFPTGALECQRSSRDATDISLHICGPSPTSDPSAKGAVCPAIRPARFVEHLDFYELGSASATLASLATSSQLCKEGLPSFFTKKLSSSSALKR